MDLDDAHVTYLRPISTRVPLRSTYSRIKILSEDDEFGFTKSVPTFTAVQGWAQLNLKIRFIDV